MSNESDNVIMQELLKQYKEGKLQVNNLQNAQMGQMNQQQWNMQGQQGQMNPVQANMPNAQSPQFGMMPQGQMNPQMGGMPQGNMPQQMNIQNPQAFWNNQMPMGNQGQMNPQQSQMDPNTMAQFYQWQQQNQQFMQQQMFQQFYQQQMLQQQQQMQQQIQQEKIQEQIQQQKILQQQRIQQQRMQQMREVPENWNLTFERKENNDRIVIQISTDKLLKDAFNSYRIKSQITTGIKFTLGGKPLNENLKISESGLRNEGVITVEKDNNNHPSPQVPQNQQNQFNQNQFAQMNQNIQPNVFNIQDNKYNIIFEQKAGGSTMTMQTTPDELVSALLQRYKGKMLYDGIMKFIFNGQNLDENLTLKQAGLKNGSKILVIGTKDIEGA